MEIEKLLEIINADFYTGVPDSQLKALCNYLQYKYGQDKKHHIIAANEGNAAAIASGYYLATGKIPVIYLQNSGIGNIINPVASLTNNLVYAIPQIFIIGYRGEPNVKDEPQHIFQGQITLKLLECIDISYFVITKETSSEEINAAMLSFNKLLQQGKSVAFVVKKGALSFDKTVEYKNNNKINREEAIQHIVKVSKDAPIISTTGKISRELYETRDLYNNSHKYDFLTVGSMGHASSIALGIAINKPDKKIYLLDGDGAMLMHMGAMALIGSVKPKNLIHVVLNNCAHESVGGCPTVCDVINIEGIAKSCGYEFTASVSDIEELDKVLNKADNAGCLSFIEVKCSLGAREDLGRPKTSPIENKNSFMDNIRN